MGLEPKPLQPLTYGNVLIVGAKASNFDDELKTHPRVIIWSSQEEHWTNKDLPQNVRAVFITKWIGHAEFNKIHLEAQKRHITIFNPNGTGMIARQVKELLSMNTPSTPIISAPTNSNIEAVRPKTGGKIVKKLHVLIRYINFDKKNIDNARSLMEHARELGITTTLGSLNQFIAVERKKKFGPSARSRVLARVKKPTQAETHRVHKYVDVTVQILDNMVKELQDMRDFLVATTEENRALKLRIEKFKKALDND